MEDMTVGSINGIYFTKDGFLPSSIVDNLKQIALEAAPENFETIFWTDTTRLDVHVRENLVSAGVIVKDYRNTNAVLDRDIDQFVQQGHEGDICSYAIASDMLRVAVAGMVPNDHYYIYVDCNDVYFLNLREDLKKLPEKFQRNPWGFSFPVEVTVSNFMADARNDRMIVRKQNNPIFFSNFFMNYVAAVLVRAKHYVRTDDAKRKKEQTDTISSFISSCEFGYSSELPGKVRLRTHSSNFVLMADINFCTYINTERYVELGNTWRKVTAAEELDEMLSGLGSSEDKQFLQQNHPPHIQAVIRKAGTLDARLVLHTLEALGAGDDIVVSDDFISIPKPVDVDLDVLQTKLMSQSKTGKAYPVSVDKDRLLINICELNPQSPVNGFIEKFYSGISNAVSSSNLNAHLNANSLTRCPQFFPSSNTVDDQSLRTLEMFVALLLLLKPMLQPTDSSSAPKSPGLGRRYGGVD